MSEATGLDVELGRESSDRPVREETDASAVEYSRSSVELAGRSSKPNLPGNVTKVGHTFAAVRSNRRCCVDTNTERSGISALPASKGSS